MYDGKQSVLQEPSFDVHRPISFRKPGERLTVVPLYLAHHGKNLILVSPSKGHDNLWIPPQGEIHAGESPAQAAIREGGEELDLKPHNFTNMMIPLGSCIHDVPARNGKGARKNHLYFIGCELVNVHSVKLNAENKSWTFVQSRDVLLSLVQPQDLSRPTKFLGMLEAIDKLILWGKLRWRNRHVLDRFVPESALVH